MKKSNKKGFTIVELVIVIAVIAILAAVMIPTFDGVIEKANKSAVQQVATSLYKEAYALDLADGTLDGKDGEDDIMAVDKDKAVLYDGKTFMYVDADKNYTARYDGAEWKVEETKDTDAMYVKVNNAYKKALANANKDTNGDITSDQEVTADEIKFVFDYTAAADENPATLVVTTNATVPSGYDKWSLSGDVWAPATN